jgi:hypothetical protein
LEWRLALILRRWLTGGITYRQERITWAYLDVLRSKDHYKSMEPGVEHR